MSPWQFFSPEQIARATGAPQANIEAHWPLIAAELDARGVYDRANVIGIVSTIAVETGNFRPIPENASGDAYEGRRDLGNVVAGDGRRYKGRGYVQITGRSNYRSIGDAIGVDLVANPDLALDPSIAAKILVEFWMTHGVKGKSDGHWYSLPELSREPDWPWVRRVVNGGEHGLDQFLHIVQTLDGMQTESTEGHQMATFRTTDDGIRLRESPRDGAVITSLPKDAVVEEIGERAWRLVRWMNGGKEYTGWMAADYLEEVANAVERPPEPVQPAPSSAYNPDFPMITQEHDYDCSQDSLEWGLGAMGRHPTDQWLEDTMIAEGIMSRELGLLDATGAALAGFVNRHYGEPGELGGPALEAYNIDGVSFAQISHLAGSTAILAGARNWGGSGRGHWCGVRRFTDPHLEIAQPGGHGPIYGQETMDHDGWDQRAPWSSVVLKVKGS